MLIRKIFVVLITSFMLIAFTNCCTTKTELKEDAKNNIMSKERPPSPGNAEIKCNVVDLFERGNKSFCKIKLISVLNYGAGTRPIGNGSVIEFEIRNEYKSDLEKLITNGQEAKLLITEVPSGMGMENSTSYRIVKIIN